MLMFLIRPPSLRACMKIEEMRDFWPKGTISRRRTAVVSCANYVNLAIDEDFRRRMWPLMAKKTTFSIFQTSPTLPDELVKVPRPKDRGLVVVSGKPGLNGVEALPGVENVPRRCRQLYPGLPREGWQGTGMDAVQVCREYQPDVVVLDIMLPDIDGIEVCKQIREFSFCSILFLSSKNDDIDKILGLSCGGDDYITKPFSPREIVYRIKAQLRRQQYQSVMRTDVKGLLTVGGLALDKESSRIYKNEKEIDLTGREFLLLSYLMENADKIISKERLYEQVWGEYSSICDNTIMVHIRHIREKIEDTPSTPKQLITIKGLGYKPKKRAD